MRSLPAQIGNTISLFWVLHTCLNEMGCTESCARCGYCSNQCHDPDSENEKCLGHNREGGEREHAKTVSDDGILPAMSMPATTT